MQPTLLTGTSHDPIVRIITTKFGVQLSSEQLQVLIEAQPEQVKKAVQSEPITLAALDMLVESISEAITGICYPTEHSTPYYKEYFKNKLNENKSQYFGFSGE